MVDLQTLELVLPGRAWLVSASWLLLPQCSQAPSPSRPQELSTLGMLFAFQSQF